MRIYTTKRFFLVFAAVLCVLVLAMAGVAAAKSLYVVPGHHTGQFQAYNINPDGTMTYQNTYGVTVNSPSGMAVHDDPDVGTVFITSEFSAGIHMFDGKNLQTIGTVTTNLPSNLAGIDVDEANNIVYALRKGSRSLYICDFDPLLLPSTTALQPRPGPITLPGMSYGYGISFDDSTGYLWVSDPSNSSVRAYDPATWTEVGSETYTVTAPDNLLPIDVAVDSTRKAVYSVCMAGGGGTPGASRYLNRFDLTSGTQQNILMGVYGVGIAVDEATGFVYVTGQSPYSINVWDPYTGPGTQIQQLLVSGFSGAPAGIAIGNVGVNPLNLSKDDGLGDDECVNAGANITYDICFDNAANTFDVDNVTLVDTLPADVAFVSATGGGTYDSSNHEVTWNIGPLSAGASEACVELVVQVDLATAPGSTIKNDITIDSDQTEITTVNELTAVCIPQPDLWAVEYRWGAPAPGYSFANWPIFEGWMDVRIENRGTVDALNVTGTMSSCPLNTSIIDGEVMVGDIPSGGSAWSSDTFTTHVDMANPVDPCDECFWTIEYDDAAGVHHVVENVPEFPPGEGPPSCP